MYISYVHRVVHEADEPKAELRLSMFKLMCISYVCRVVHGADEPKADTCKAHICSMANEADLWTL
jgi:hypothetical protein